MKLTVHRIDQQTIQEFAEDHDLEMVVHERSDNMLPRFYASFRCAEVKDGCMLRSDAGNGNTVDAAIADYAESISQTTLVLFACSPERKEIDVPRLVSA